jgi:hypothetical protein
MIKSIKITFAQTIVPAAPRASLQLQNKQRAGLPALRQNESKASS